ncbi:MAG: thiaminase/transcriptional activator TenA [Acidimicrobiales bacterium]|jgi:thiaminase/transcriptional activator TenA
MSFVEECKEISEPVWGLWLHHAWTEALFAGELSDEQFRYWLIQDLPYLGQNITEMIYPKVPATSPFVELSREYAIRAETSRVEREVIGDLGSFALSRFAARPTRDAAINFWIRTAHEGTFGELCAALYVCYSFAETFGTRYRSDAPAGLPPLQRAWVEQWVDPYFETLHESVRDGLDEAGANASESEREQMKWLFLRGTQLQIATFDAAWKLSDPWPGEGEETSVVGGAPWMD